MQGRKRVKNVEKRAQITVVTVPKIKCPYCMSGNYQQYGNYLDPLGRVNRYMLCEKCGRRFKIVEK